MSAFNIDFKDPTTWLLTPLLAPLLPFALLGGCEEEDTDIECSPLTDVQDIAAGYEHTCALLTSGSVKCWGYNTLTKYSMTATAVAAGGEHTCALLTSGGVMCWGNNEYGQLGDGTAGEDEYETTPVGLSSDIQAISAGTYHTCALLTSGGMKCWGANWVGQLGDGTTTDMVIPVDVSGLSSDVQAIATGAHHTCAVLGSGGMKCWGRNANGQLGDGTTTDWTTPVDVVGLSSGVQDIAAGWWHTCALLDSGGVKCWGSNSSGGLGDGTTENKTTPVDVSGLSSDAQAIAAGWDHTCALLTSGGVKCWGNNEYGQLGDGTTDDKTIPVNVFGLSSDVQAIEAGGLHTCAVLDSGSVMCCGYNGSGQLGDGTKENKATPVDVSGL